MHNNWQLSDKIVKFTDKDFLTLSDVCEGIQILGGTGSGKTSGSGKSIAKSFLYAGFGGLILTAKKGERELWESYFADPNVKRNPNDLIIVSPKSGGEFNFLQYEMVRQGEGGRDTENVVELFFHILEASGKQSSQSNEDPFWTHSLKQMLRNAIDLVFAAKGTIGLQEIKDVIKSAPQSREEAHSQTWRENSFCYRCISEADPKKRDDEQHRDFLESVDYWTETFPTLADKTRSIIVVMFSSMADYFLRGKLYSLFCSGLTITPEMTEQGKVILLDLPVKEYSDRGRFTQILFKYMWQKAIERRSVKQSPRPVFLWADESQNFCTSYDMQFQATARSSRACTVYLTQNLPNYYAAFGGGDKAKHEANSLLSNLQTKIFHANTDIETNQYPADLIGKIWQDIENSSGSVSSPQDYQMPFMSGQSNSSSTFGTSKVLEYKILPRWFRHLKTGGFKHNGLVDAIIMQGGRFWSNGEDYLPHTFTQDGFN